MQVMKNIILFLIKSTINFGCGTVLLKKKFNVDKCKQSIIVYLIWIKCNLNFKLSSDRYLNALILLLDYCFVYQIYLYFIGNIQKVKIIWNLIKSFVGSIGEIKKGRNTQTRLNVLKSYKRVKIVVKRWCVVSIKRKHTFYRRVYSARILR